MTRETPSAWVIVPAAGVGQRFSERSDKLTVHLDGLPILVRTVEALLDARHVAGAVVVVSPEKKQLYQRLIKEYGHRKPTLFTEGGPTRRASVYNGLLALPPEVGIVAIHDAARPLISQELVDMAIETVTEGAPGIVVGIPVQDTLKEVTGDTRDILATADRSRFWRAQTPQVFPKDVLMKAHQQVPEHTQAVTDDAQLVEMAGLGPVRMLPGEERNLKITTPEDLALAEAWLHIRRKAPR